MTGYSPAMTSADALLWNIELDPVLRSTITTVALFDRAPDWDRLVAKLTRGVVDIPRLRQRVVVPPFGLGPPEWVDDPEFDLGYHLRRVRACAPGTLRSVLDIAEPLSMAGFDRTRPLWEFTVVEGLEDGKAALVQKLHHSIADGVGGIRLAAMLLDLEHDTETESCVLPSATAVPATDLAARSILRQLPGAASTARRAPRLLADVTASVARHPMATAAAASAMAASVGRMLATMSGPTSPLLTGRTVGRRFDVLEVPLGALKDAAHDAGCTLNATFLAATIGGAARYHAKHGVVVDDVRVDMPVNLRDEGDPEGGNRFAPTWFRLPMRIDDPVARIRAVGAIADQSARRPRSPSPTPLPACSTPSHDRSPPGSSPRCSRASTSPSPTSPASPSRPTSPAPASSASGRSDRRVVRRSRCRSCRTSTSRASASPATPVQWATSTASSPVSSTGSTRCSPAALKLAAARSRARVRRTAARRGRRSAR